MLTLDQAAVVKGMLARGDKQHDIAAHFGVNPGRIIEVKSGQRYADVQPLPADELPPRRRAPADLLITETMELAEQVEVLEQLIQTTPEGSPSVILDITPAIAQYVIDHRNKNNRNIRPGKIKLFVRDLKDGRWQLTGDTVRFGTNGELLDGQNRLRACALANIVLRTHVVFGLAPETFAVLDSGAGRTPQDTFKVMGVPNSGDTSRAVRWIMLLSEMPPDRSRTIPNEDLLEHYRTRVNQDLLEAKVKLAKEVRPIPTGMLAAMLYMFARRDGVTTKIFEQDLEKGLHGAGALLSKIRHARQEPGKRVKELWLTSHTVLAWKSYRDGRRNFTARQLRGSDDPEQHPTIA